jgi:hypothetical protein
MKDKTMNSFQIAYLIAIIILDIIYGSVFYSKQGISEARFVSEPSCFQ